MKSFVCDTCGLRVLNGEMPEKCPNCFTTEFTEQEDAIKEPTGENEELEKKHIPLIEINKACSLDSDNCVNVNVKIGEIQHPMEAEHSIQFIDFYINKNWVGRTKLTPDLNPSGGIHIKATEGKIQVLELCNLHGAWMSEKDI